MCINTPGLPELDAWLCSVFLAGGATKTSAEAAAARVLAAAREVTERHLVGSCDPARPAVEASVATAVTAAATAAASAIAKRHGWVIQSFASYAASAPAMAPASLPVSLLPSQVDAPKLPSCNVTNTLNRVSAQEEEMEEENDGEYVGEEDLKAMLLDCRSTAKKPKRKRAGQGLTEGTQVKIFGLVSAPEFNGAKGTCEVWDSDKARWKVLLANGDTKWLRPQNLQWTYQADVAPESKKQKLVECASDFTAVVMKAGG